IKDAHCGNDRDLTVLAEVKERRGGDHSQRGDIFRGNVVDDFALFAIFCAAEVFGSDGAAGEQELLAETMLNEVLKLLTTLGVLRLEVWRLFIYPVPRQDICGGLA